MASLYVTEYASIQDNVPVEPAITSTVVTFTGTAGVSAAFNGATRYVRLQADGICSVLFGTGPTALTSNRRMTAGQTEYFKVPVNQSFKVSAITNT